jgi:hypothetical protein
LIVSTHWKLCRCRFPIVLACNFVCMAFVQLNLTHPSLVKISQSIKKKTEFWSRNENGYKWNDFVSCAHNWQQLFSLSIAWSYWTSWFYIPYNLQYPLCLALYPHNFYES